MALGAVGKRSIDRIEVCELAFRSDRACLDQIGLLVRVDAVATVFEGPAGGGVFARLTTFLVDTKADLVATVEKSFIPLV